MRVLTIIIFALLANLTIANAQTTYWKSIEENSNSLIYLNFGYDFGVTAQVGYGYYFNSKKPIMLTTDISIPMGNNLIDDFKFRLGGQIGVLERANFNLYAKYLATIKKVETNMANQISFGSEFSITTGYFKPKWHLAFDIGIDKTAATRIKHSDLIENNFPDIQNGWFNNTAAYLFYGIQGSKSINSSMDMNIKLGATKATNKDVDALLPIYLQFGLTKQFN